MKQVSTAARKQINNFGEQKLTIGLDLGDRSSWYCMLDGSGAVLLEQKLGTTPKAATVDFRISPGDSQLFRLLGFVGASLLFRCAAPQRQSPLLFASPAVNRGPTLIHR